MKLDEKGAELICSFEGFESKPYLDSVKIPTIGFGSTYYENGTRVTLLDNPITKEHALNMFKSIGDRFSLAVSNKLSVKLTQNQFNACVSIAYNIGTGNFLSSTLLKKINLNPNDPSIKSEFMKWNKAGGKELEGLTTRRKKEADLYFTK